VQPDLSASPFLQRLSERHSPAEPDALINSVAAIKTANELKALKQHFFLSWSVKSLTGTEFNQLSAWQTIFADATISKALELAWAEKAKRLKIKVPLKGLFVLGLGKLGGYDLNLSSDVDLVAFYDRESFPIPQARGQAYEANQILKRMSQILQPAHDPDFVWRVDWRLRPEASTRGLAMEVDAAREFYFFRALPWHRLALIKARVVAGDQVAGQGFLSSLEPFLWRRNLDYRALDELASIKSRINLEHPGLKAERAKPQPITSDPSGFNVKLGTGGIREIEFFANAAQMIWGGKQGELRTSNTLKTLLILSRTEHYSSDDVKELSRIYKRLRRLENAVQMRGNEHTHILPKGEALEQVKTLANDDLKDLDKDRQFVTARFADIFQDEVEDSTILPRFVKALSGEALAISESWLSGFGRYSVRKNAAMTNLAPELFWRISASGQEPEEAIAQLDRFFATLSRSEQYLRLLAEHPQLLDPLITPLLHSPHMASLLDMSPHIIDVFISPVESLDTDFVFASTDFETRLESLRRFVNEHLYLTYYELMAGVRQTAEVQTRLSDLAEVALEAALKIVADDLNMDTLPIAIIGLGKLGTRAMMPLSDIDLLFLFPDATDSALAAKIVRRLRTVLTAKMSEGIVYELDMRLRPSGNQGPVAVSRAAFESYQREKAWVWEHLALTRARCVAGPAALTDVIQTIIDQVLKTRKGDEQIFPETVAMRNRLIESNRAERGNLWSLKHASGGLMEIEFLTQTGTLLNGLSGCRSVPTALPALRETGWISDNDMEKLQAAFDLQQALQQIERVAVDGALDPNGLGAELKTVLVQAAGKTDFEELESVVEDLQSKAAEIVATVFIPL